MDQELVEAVAYASDRHCVRTHQMAALFCLQCVDIIGWVGERAYRL